MKGFKRKDMGRTRGGRIGRRGAVLFYLGFAGIFIGGWTAEAMRAPDLVIGAVLAVTFGMAFGGLVLTVAGRRCQRRSNFDPLAASEI